MAISRALFNASALTLASENSRSEYLDMKNLSCFRFSELL